MSPDDLHGCPCESDERIARVIHNRAGLSALSWRVDTHAGFRQRMLSSLSLWRPPQGPAATRPLAALGTRENADAAIAYVDAAACVADVLAFYQERIANEGFLRTATERRSVLELARAVGYELRPGVAASACLVFTVEDAPGAPGVCTIAAATPVQSVPPQGKLPQVFETDEELLARAEWNALRPRQTRAADLALVDFDGTLRLALLYETGSLPANTAGLRSDLASASLFRLDPGLPVAARVDVLAVAHIYLDDQASTVEAGELLLFVGSDGRTLKQLVLRVREVEREVALGRVRVELAALPSVVSFFLTVTLGQEPSVVGVGTIGKLAQTSATQMPLTGGNVATAITQKAWRETELQAMIVTQNWSRRELVQAATTSVRRARKAIDPAAGAFSFGTRVGFFGHNAPKWASLPKQGENGAPYPKGWDTDKPTIWTDSQGAAISPHTFLERPVPKLAPGSWVVFDAPDQPATAYAVYDAREVSRADYGLSARVLALRLADHTGAALQGTPAPAFSVRDSTAHVVSQRQALAELPIDAPVAAGSTRIELSTMVLGLARGKRLAFVGARADLPGVDGAEIAVVEDVVHRAGRSVLVLREGLKHDYVRDSLVIHANVATASHGERVNEVLGSGDASRSLQRFVLRKPPTTHLSAATASGAVNTLEVRVNGLLWSERGALYGAGADEHVYVTRIDDDGHMQVLFGDGRQGARLPSGQMNVHASYRSGIGADGEVDAHSLSLSRTMPLGLRGVTNPLPATGAQNPERLDDARRNAPLALLSFGRVVSRSDYEDFARAFPGIGKARADLAWAAGGTRVLLSVTGATGGAPGAQVMSNLHDALASLSDGAQGFQLAAATLRLFRCSVHIAIDARHDADAVLAAARSRLQSAFSFAARELAQSVSVAELSALLHQVAGVVAANVTVLHAHDEATNPSNDLQIIPAAPARWQAGAMRAAELLLLNPVALEVAEARP